MQEVTLGNWRLNITVSSSPAASSAIAGGRSAFIVYLSIEDFQALREGQQKNSAQRRAAIPVEHSSDHVRLIRDSA